MNLLKSVSLTTLALGALALPAMADWHGHGYYGGGYRGGYYGGPRVSIGIGVPLFSPYYCAPAPVYYAPAPYYYEPAPVVARPVVVGREVAGGDLIVDVQRTLARKGYYNGVVDGDLGPRTRASIREWQIDCRLPVTGRIDSATLRSLALL